MRNLFILLLILLTPLAYAAEKDGGIRDAKEIMTLPPQYLGLVTIIGNLIDDKYVDANEVLLRTKGSYCLIGSERIEYGLMYSYKKGDVTWHTAGLKDKSVRIRFGTIEGIKIMNVVNKSDGAILNTYVVTVE